MYKINESDSLVANDGNFRVLLRFRIESGDTILENHLKMSGKNATYISKTSANELIQCCGKEVLDIILKRIKLAKFYCVIFDETTDVSHTSQHSLSIRYIENIVREDFVGFVDLHTSNYSQSDEFLDSELDFSENALNTNIVEPIITGKILGSTVVKKFRIRFIILYRDRL